MPVKRLCLIFITILLGLGGCGGRQMVEKMAPEREKAFAELVLADLQNRDTRALQRRSPDWLAKLEPEASATLAEQVPATGRPALLNFNWRQRSDGERETRLVYGLDGANRHALVIVNVAQSGNSPQLRLTGVAVRPLERSFESIYDFRLADGGVAGWLVLVLQVAAITATVAALWRVWRTDLFRPRWLWTLGCIVGIGVVQAPWPTSHLTLAPLSFQLFSAGMLFANPFGPWLLRMSIPVVAIAVLLRRRTPERSEAEAVTAS